MIPQQMKLPKKIILLPLFHNRAKNTFLKYSEKSKYKYILNLNSAELLRELLILYKITYVRKTFMD